MPIIPVNIVQGEDASVADGGGLAVRAAEAHEWRPADVNDRGFSDVAWGAGVFVAVGAGLLRWSEDGTAWHHVDSLE